MANNKKEKELLENEEIIETKPVEEKKEEVPSKKLFSSPKKETGCRLS